MTRCREPSRWIRLTRRAEIGIEPADNEVVPLEMRVMSSIEGHRAFRAKHEMMKGRNRETWRHSRRIGGVESPSGRLLSRFS